MRIDDLVIIVSYGEDVNEVFVFIRRPYENFMNVLGCLLLGRLTYGGVDDRIPSKITRSQHISTRINGLKSTLIIRINGLKSTLIIRFSTHNQYFSTGFPHTTKHTT